MGSGPWNPGSRAAGARGLARVAHCAQPRLRGEEGTSRARPLTRSAARPARALALPGPSGMTAPGEETVQSGAACPRPDWASFFRLCLVLSGSLTLGRVPLTPKTQRLWRWPLIENDDIAQQKVIRKGVTPTKAEISAANKWKDPSQENTFPRMQPHGKRRRPGFAGRRKLHTEACAGHTPVPGCAGKRRAQPAAATRYQPFLRCACPTPTSRARCGAAL